MLNCGVSYEKHTDIGHNFHVISVIWALLKAPDLAITEAAVGAGVTSVLFFITLKKIRLIRDNEHKENSDENKAE